MFVVGPQMHCLEGIGLSEPVRLEFDVERGTHYGEFIWTHPVEDEEHARYFPIGTEPSCWMQVGYASGFSSEFMGRQVLYREVECQSMGQPACRIVGMPVEEWGEEGDARYAVPACRRQLRLSKCIGPRTGRSPRGAGRIARASATESEQPVGISPGFNSVLHMVQRVAPTNATVLFLGRERCRQGSFRAHACIG